MILLIKLILTLLVTAVFAVSFFYPSMGSGVLDELEVLGVSGAIGLLCVFLLFVYFYCRDLQTTLERISTHNRICSPKSVWLMFLIPYNFIEDFFIVNNIAASLRRESKSNPALRKLQYFGIQGNSGDSDFNSIG